MHVSSVRYPHEAYRDRDHGADMNKIKTSIAAVLTAAATLVCIPPPQVMLFSVRVADAQDDWKTEFETVCARTQDAAGMGTDELKILVERCDKLKPRIEKLDETQRKVYLKRLKMCRDLYAFVLETKENK
jgi:hypothetical protein